MDTDKIQFLKSTQNQNYWSFVLPPATQEGNPTAFEIPSLCLECDVSQVLYRYMRSSEKQEFLEETMNI